MAQKDELIKELAALQSYSLRGLIETVNKINKGDGPKILKEDIVSIQHYNDLFFLLYFR